MTKREFYNLLKKIHQRKPFKLTLEGFIRQCETGFCPILAVAYKLNKRMCDRNAWHSACFIEANRKVVKLNFHTMSRIIDAADNYMESTDRAELLKLLKLGDYAND